MSKDEYFKAVLKTYHGNQRTVYGVSFGSHNQTPRTEAEHIALVRGFGKSKVKSLKIYSSGELWYNAQYGRKK
jgi:hypothetical protein